LVTANPSEQGYTGKVEKVFGHFSPRRDFREVKIIIILSAFGRRVYFL